MYEKQKSCSLDGEGRGEGDTDPVAILECQ
jgi:hypothetical protein